MGKKLEKKIMASKTKFRSKSTGGIIANVQQLSQNESYRHEEEQNSKQYNFSHNKSEQSINHQNFFSANRILQNIFFKIERHLRNVISAQLCTTSNKIQKNQQTNKEHYTKTQPSIGLKFTNKGERKIYFNFKKQIFKKSENKDNLLNELDIEVQNFKKRIENGKYIFYSDFVDSVDTFINKMFSKYSILDQKLFFKTYHQIMTTEIQNFKEQKKKNFDFLICNWTQFKQKTDFYPKYQLRPRLFNQIQKYISVLQDTKFNVNKIYDVKNILKSDMKPNCQKNCCCNKDLSNLEKFSECILNESTWRSDCCDKNQRLECDGKCGCSKVCKNRALQSFDPSSDLKNFKIQLVWGIDYYTRKNIIYLLPKEISNDIKDKIVDKLIRYVNLVGYEGWNITNILSKMIQECERRLNINQSMSSDIDSKRSNSQGLYIENESSLLLFKHHPYLNQVYKKDLQKSKIEQSQQHGMYNSSMSKKSKRKSKKQHLKQQKNQIQKQKNLSIIQKDFLSINLQGITLQKELSAYKSLYRHSLIKQLRQGLRIHSKGLGVICDHENGIKKNQLISIYQGEVYPSWYWSIKQQVIKNFLTGVKKDKYKEFKEYKNNYNIDFYNIQVEKHKDEPKGREIFVIDPIINGNFVSRLSHSCDPNCWAIPVISNGQYYIAMYAIKNIDRYEELTFDYCSFTENEKEYLNSVCLCGKNNCKGYYLGYTKKHQMFFNEELKRNLIDFPKTLFLKSNKTIMKVSKKKPNSKIIEQLRLNSFGENTFKNSPDFIKQWAYLCLQQIQDEKQYLIDKIQNMKLKQTYYNDPKACAQLEVENLYFQRIHNLIITIDKIRNFCQNQKKELQNIPPLQTLKLKERAQYFREILACFQECSLVNSDQRLRVLIQDVINDINTYKYFKEYFKEYASVLNVQQDVQKILVMKIAFFELSAFYKDNGNIGNKKIYFEIFSDILFFHAFNIINFKLVEYDSFEVNVKIRNCDLSNPHKSLIKSQHSEEQQKKKLEEVLITIPKQVKKKNQWKFFVEINDILVKSYNRKIRKFIKLMEIRHLLISFNYGFY